MKNKLVVESIFIILLFFISSVYIYQSNATTTSDNQSSGAVTLQLLVTNQQVPDFSSKTVNAQIVKDNNLIDAINISQEPSTADQQLQQLVTCFTTKCTNYDVISIDIGYAAEMEANGWLTPITSVYNSTTTGPTNTGNYFKSEIQAGTWNNVLYGAPYFYQTGALIYRKDILARNGLTINDFSSWAGFKSGLNKILDNKSEAALNPNLEGYTFQGDAYEGGVINLVEWMGGSGGTFLKNNGTEANFQSAIPALTWMSSLIAPIYNSPLNNPGSFVSDRSELVGDEGSANTMFMAGNSVMERNWQFAYANALNDPILNGSKPLQFANGTNYSNAQDPWYANNMGPRVGITTLPVNTTFCGVGNSKDCHTVGTGGAILGIPSYLPANRKAAALQYIKAEGGQAFQLNMALNSTAGNTPALKSIYATNGPLKGTSKAYLIPFGQNVFPYGINRPDSPYYPSMSTAIQPLYHAAFAGTISVSQAVTEMDTAVNNILAAASSSTKASPGFTSIGVFMMLASVAAITVMEKRKKKNQ